MTDIIERLRAQDISGHGHFSALVREAANEIELLRRYAESLEDEIERVKQPESPK